MEKEIKITPPEGFEIDKEHSTFDCIKFKPIAKKRWRDDENAIVNGYWISNGSYICNTNNNDYIHKNIHRDYNVFATEKQAKSALAMARISQIMANDERFGGVVTDEEWGDCYTEKYIITRKGNHIVTEFYHTFYHILAFHTLEQRNLFLKENEDLVKDFLMID